MDSLLKFPFAGRPVASVALDLSFIDETKMSAPFSFALESMLPS